MQQMTQLVIGHVPVVPAPHPLVEKTQQFTLAVEGTGVGAKKAHRPFEAEVDPGS
jgi:hypothetical protein